MSIFKRTFIVFLLMITLIAVNASAQNWYKGNLHTHSLWSDGDDYPEMIVDWYKSHGYNFVGLSEHNKLQVGAAWINVPHDVKKRDAFQRYLDKYGKDVVDFKTWPNDSLRVRLKTYEEYRGMFEEKGKFMVFQSEEITSNYDGNPVHINATNILKVVPRQIGNNIAEVIQNSVNMVNAQREETGQPMFAHINHPNFGLSVTAEDIKQVRNARFFEVFNGGPPTNNYGYKGHDNDSTEVIWDKVNAHYLNLGLPLIFGLGVDDTHHYHEFNSGLHNPGRAWVMVYAPELKLNTLVEAMEAGNFYASTGVVLNKLTRNDKQIAVQVKKEEGVSYRIQFIGLKKGKNKSELLKEVRGSKGAYKIGSDDLFVRAKIISSKLKSNPFRKGDVEIAWTQPVQQ